MRANIHYLPTAGQVPGPEHAFGPEDICVMRQALDRSWSALDFAHFEDDGDRLATRERLARRIVEEAARGERSVPVLSGLALGALEPRRAGALVWRASKYVS